MNVHDLPRWTEVLELSDLQQQAPPMMWYDDDNDNNDQEDFFMRCFVSYMFDGYPVEGTTYLCSFKRQVDVGTQVGGFDL